MKAILSTGIAYLTHSVNTLGKMADLELYRAAAIISIFVAIIEPAIKGSVWGWQCGSAGSAFVA